MRKQPGAEVVSLYSDTCPFCNNSHPKASEGLPKSYSDEIKKEYEKLIKNIYNEGNPDDALLRIAGTLTARTVQNSYRHIAVDFSTTDAEMLTRLTRDTWHFHAAKNYQELRDLTLALRDKNGNLREWDEYRDEAEKICEKYNETWMRTEYNFSIASSQSAARYMDFQKEKESINFLKFQTVGDSAVRPEHALLDGIILSIDDPRLDELWTPLGWGCRCEWVQWLTKALNPETKDIPKIYIPKMFRTNLSKQGLIYPKDHSYYIGIPKAAIRKSIAYLPPENTYLTVNISKDAQIEIHPLHGYKELAENINTSKLLKNFDKKAKIQLLPVIDINKHTQVKDMASKRKFLPESYLKKFPLKNPDALYNGRPVEFENANGSKSSVQNAIKWGKKQSDFIVIHLPDNMDLENVEHIIKGQLKHYQNNESITVWTVNENGKREYTTKQKR